MLIQKQQYLFHSKSSGVLLCHMLYIYFSFLTFSSLLLLLASFCDAALTQTHKSSGDVQLTSSPSLACQNLETVTLTPPSELTTPLPATPPRPLSEQFYLRTPHPVSLSSTLQMSPPSPSLPQADEADEHIAKLLEMVTMGLNSLHSATVEGNSSMHAHLDQKLVKCADVANLTASYLCLLSHNLGAMGSETSGSSEQREAGKKYIFNH